MRGIHIPTCREMLMDESDGGFDYKQCQDSLCWCESPRTGKPIRGSLTKGKLTCDENGRYGE